MAFLALRAFWEFSLRLFLRSYTQSHRGIGGPGNQKPNYCLLLPLKGPEDIRNKTHKIPFSQHLMKRCGMGLMESPGDPAAGLHYQGQRITHLLKNKF